MGYESRVYIVHEWDDDIRFVDEVMQTMNC